MSPGDINMFFICFYVSYIFSWLNPPFSGLKQLFMGHSAACSPRWSVAWARMKPPRAPSLGASRWSRRSWCPCRDGESMGICQFFPKRNPEIFVGDILIVGYICIYIYMGMDQYLLIPFLGGWTSIYQLFWCSPGVQGFDTLPYIYICC